MKTRIFLTMVAAVLMATGVSAQNQYLGELDVMSYTEMDGHVAAMLDMDDDGEEDVMYIDADDSEDLSSDDIIVVLEDGSSRTVGKSMEGEHFIKGDEVLSYGEMEGHEMANIDLDEDGEMDISIVDLDDSHDLSDDDVIIDYCDGSVITVGDMDGKIKI